MRIGPLRLSEELASLRENPPAPDSVRDLLLRALVEIEERRKAEGTEAK